MAKKVKTLICACCKNENRYIREWIEHNKNCGFDNIVLYDNNDEDDLSLLDVIADYIESGFVIVENYRGQKSIQTRAYSECYKKYNDSYDYIAYIDCDEFFMFENKNDISAFLSEDDLKDYDIIRICWKNYGDNNIIKHHNNFNVLDRFKIPMPKEYKRNRECKSIIKCGLSSIKNITAHGCFDTQNACDALGRRCKNTDCWIGDEVVWSRCWINHYRTKSIQEFIEQKFYRGDASSAVAKYNTSLDLFFEYNKKTKEKVDFANSLINKEKP